MTSPNPSARISGLYAITPDEPETAELLRKTRLALSGGTSVLQYRNKSAGAALRLEQALALRKLTHEFSVPLIINDDALLAQQVDADGAHLGGEDGSIVAARAVLGKDKLIGVSCYNRASLAQDAVRQGADYVAFGSFFASTVKPGAVAASPDILTGTSRTGGSIGGDRRHHGGQRRTVAGSRRECPGGDLCIIRRGGHRSGGTTVFKFELP